MTNSRIGTWLGRGLYLGLITASASTSTGVSAQGALEEVLVSATRRAESEWIAGDAFSLADVAWLPLQSTLDLLAGYSFDSYDNIAKWAKRIESRPSFQKSVVDWFPPEMRGSK